MQRLWSYMIRYRGRYAIGLACLLATGTLAMSVPYLLKRAVDTIAAGGSAATVGWLAATMPSLVAMRERPGMTLIIVESILHLVQRRSSPWLWFKSRSYRGFDTKDTKDTKVKRYSLRCPLCPSCPLW